MAITQDIRKAATDTVYAAAGTADLAAEKLGQLVADAPARIEQLRSTDPKALGERVTQQAKQVGTQVTTKVAGLVGTIDTDAKKLKQTAQDLALRGVGQAVSAAAQAGETFEKMAERGRTAVKAWRGEAAEEIAEIAVAVEPDSEQDKSDKTTQAQAAPAPAAGADTAESKETEAEAKPAARRSTTTTRKPAAKKADAKNGDEA
ncbi:hypothetical protein [Streptomyces sp. NPDC049555]|uniref:hypothetical protein n=1 Tax=unclassified Streptomyces TaxID=2593676 RepID=UPI00341E4597